MGIIEQGLARRHGKDGKHQAKNYQVTSGSIPVLHGFSVASEYAGVAQGKQPIQELMPQFAADFGVGGKVRIGKGALVQCGEFTVLILHSVPPGSGDGGQLNSFHQHAVGYAR